MLKRGHEKLKMLISEEVWKTASAEMAEWAMAKEVADAKEDVVRWLKEADHSVYRTKTGRQQRNGLEDVWSASARW